MTKMPAFLSIALMVALVACATPEPTSTPTEEPSPPTKAPATNTAVSPTETEVQATETPSEPTSTEPSSDAGSTEEVIVIDSTYRLKVITVSVGTTVTWVYDAGLPHTVTSDTNVFNSGTLSEGETFTFTFTEEGVFPYFCQFHGGTGGSGMSGIVNVTEG